MSILSSFKALRTLCKTSALLQAMFWGIDEREAVTRADGPSGWSIALIACHLRDYEVSCLKRVTDMLATDRPVLDVWDNDDWAKQNTYALQPLNEVVADLTTRRKDLIQLIKRLGEAQWTRTGVHPIKGEDTVLDVAIKAGLHDFA